jgi:hypothetical protein
MTSEEPRDWGNLSQRISAAAAVSSFMVAAGALGYVAHQIDQNRAISRETAARQIFRQYLELAVNNPELSVPDLDDMTEPAKRDRYDNFVTHMLFACEEILAAFFKEKGWRDGCEFHIERHLSYVHDTVIPKSLGTYSPEMQCLIKEVAAKSYADTKPCKTPLRRRR